MAEITLKAETGRTRLGRLPRLRAEGKVPAVVYGAGVEPDVRHRRLAGAARGPHHRQGPQRPDRRSRSTATGDQAHRQGHAAPPRAPRRPARRLPGGRRDSRSWPRCRSCSRARPRRSLQERGVVDQELHTLTVHAKPADIPGQHLARHQRPGDRPDASPSAELTLPRGVTTDVDPEQAVVTAQVTRAVEAEAPRAPRAKRARPPRANEAARAASGRGLGRRRGRGRRTGR